MARPKPSVVLQWTDPKTYKAEEVLKAFAIYAVFYDGKPINLRSIPNRLTDETSPKYKKVSFSNSGHAFNLAEKLNHMFKTTKFQVVKLTQGTVITEIQD